MFRLGFLQCDSLGTPHTAIDGDYDRLFASLLEPHAIELIRYRADHSELPTSPHDCDGWLVPGSRRSVTDDLTWIAELARFTARVVERAVPLIGVCFGHQLIAQVMGAPVGRAAAGWNVGAIDYHLQHRPPGETDLPRPDASTFTIVASHRDQVHEVPPGTRLLATAPTCPIAGFATDSVLTVQGHPEFTAALAESLYRGRVDGLGRDVVDAAVASLTKPLDRSRVASWMAAFLLSRDASAVAAVT